MILAKSNCMMTEKATVVVWFVVPVLQEYYLIRPLF